MVTNAVVVVTCKIKGSLKLNLKYTILSLLTHTLTFVMGLQFTFWKQ